MYRVFCESYLNYQSNYNSQANKEYRAKLVEPMELLLDTHKYRQEMSMDSSLYRRLSDLLAYMEKNITRYPKLKAFLWTLESRDVKGTEYGLVTREELEEQTKIVNMFLNFQYWDYDAH